MRYDNHCAFLLLSIFLLDAWVCSPPPYLLQNLSTGIKLHFNVTVKSGNKESKAIYSILLYLNGTNSSWKMDEPIGAVASFQKLMDVEIFPFEILVFCKARRFVLDI